MTHDPHHQPLPYTSLGSNPADVSRLLDEENMDIVAEWSKAL
jgi:hypothetical protein